MTAPDGPCVDLNADVGESFGRWTLGDDSALLPWLTSANVACGFHAGDPLTLRRTVVEAAGLGVVIGAQVSYRDLAGFGRREMDIETADLAADVIYQIGALEAMCRVAGTAVRYVKPHGALYHRTLRDLGQAGAVAGAVAAYDAALPVMTMTGGALEQAALAAGLRVVREGFADRAYDPDGRLVPRTQAGALLTEPADAARQAVVVARAGTVESLCLHGDTPGAPRIAQAVRAALSAAGFDLQPFIDR